MIAGLIQRPVGLHGPTGIVHLHKRHSTIARLPENVTALHAHLSIGVTRVAALLQYAVAEQAGSRTGQVVSQSPSAGYVMVIGGTVFFESQFETGCSNTPVNYVVGLMQADAIAVLEANGLVVAVNEGCYGGSTPGVVIEQSPVGGSIVPLGWTVTINVQVRVDDSAGQWARELRISSFARRFPAPLLPSCSEVPARAPTIASRVWRSLRERANAARDLGDGTLVASRPP